MIGTPDFLAPEQARDPMSVDIRADIYALGGTLFYVLTGRVPYDGGSPGTAVGTVTGVNPGGVTTTATSGAASGTVAS